jgi:CRISPR system Cascade subunit CasD
MTIMPPASLALCFDAPMQSWGQRSRFVVRDTATEPTKSGVVGLLAAALGIPRDDDNAVIELARLKMGVRVDREGTLERDYHTVQNVPDTTGKNHRNVESSRYYLAGALFLTVIEGTEDQLQRLHQALTHPRWPLYLGRRAFVPARPIASTGDPSPIIRRPLAETLATHPWLENQPRIRRAAEHGELRWLRTVTDSNPADPASELRHDFPLSFASGNRRHGPRTVRVGHVQLTGQMLHLSLCSLNDTSALEWPLSHHVLSGAQMTLWLSRIILNLDHRDSLDDLKDVTQMHRRLMSMFPDGLGTCARRQVGLLFRVETSGDTRRILAQSSIQPDLGRLPRQYGYAEAMPLDGFLESLADGMKARYRITANPAKQLPRGHNDPDRGRPGQRIALHGTSAETWWQQRARNAGLTLHTAIMIPQRDLVGKPESRGGKPGSHIRHAAAQYDGTATIHNVHATRDAIRYGIGRGKPYGCGLLTLIPTRQTAPGTR